MRILKRHAASKPRTPVAYQCEAPRQRRATTRRSHEGHDRSRIGENLFGVLSKRRPLVRSGGGSPRFARAEPALWNGRFEQRGDGVRRSAAVGGELAQLRRGERNRGWSLRSRSFPLHRRRRNSRLSVSREHLRDSCLFGLAGNQCPHLFGREGCRSSHVLLPGIIGQGSPPTRRTSL